MKIPTGRTVYQLFTSLDSNNNPVSAATFDIVTLKNGTQYSGVTVLASLVDDFRGIFSASWSADTTGDYQIYIKNDVTNVIFLSEIVNVLPDSAFDQNIFIGL
jgi:hypothetical protein